ncbi:SHOCT domain-containing protein [Streptomyces sp. NPDC018045]|uniref:SHOCT domain-containing protein n=1 Tax=Streptomyces sp. NPDC018045 TaxID=3365037 RepID=UPI00378B2B5A
MYELAHPWAGGGPGPWVVLFPLFWAAVVFGVVTLLRRTVRRGRRRPVGGLRGAGAAQAAPAGPSPIDLLARRFATGEIDEEEYWRRLSVLDERFGTEGKSATV